VAERSPARSRLLVGRGNPMQTYRAFLVDKQGKAVDAKILDCKNDQAAMETAKQYLDGCSVQVWKERRLIGFLKEETDSRDPEA